MLYNTTTTTTTSAHLATTSMRAKTSWPLAFTSTTSTSKMEKCYMLNLPQTRLPLQSSMVLHLHSQSGLVNFEHNSTSVSLSTSTSWISPTMRGTLLQQRLWFYRQQQEHVKTLRLYGLHKHVKTSEMNRHYFQQIRHVARTRSSLGIYNRYNKTSMHKMHFRMQQLQQYVEQVKLLVTSSRTRRNPKANQTIYFVDFRGPTSVGKCFDNSDINMPQDLAYNSTPCYRALYIHLDRQRHHNNSSFKN